MQYSQLDENNADDSLHLTINDDFSSPTPSPSRGIRGKGPADSSLSEPLNSDVPHMEEDDDDPFYVFREDLYRKLELVDEGLTTYLRIVNQTVSSPTVQVLYSRHGVCVCV